MLLSGMEAAMPYIAPDPSPLELGSAIMSAVISWMCLMNLSDTPGLVWHLQVTVREKERDNTRLTW